MTSAFFEINILCTIDGDSELKFIRMDLCNGDRHITTLEYSDITSEYAEMLDVNSQANIFSSTQELETSLVNAQILKFLGEQRNDPKLDLLLNIRMKMNHQQGRCSNGCIMCNPDLGDDPFPDFTFDTKFCEPKGEA